mgnify:CR=1 FL=1
MIRVMLGLCCFVGAGDVGTSTGTAVLLAICGAVLMLWGNKAIAEQERDSEHL